MFFGLIKVSVEAMWIGHVRREIDAKNNVLEHKVSRYFVA